ncbi:hypothetical protein [Eoetvoesiella caeni]|uniref:NlpE-like protein n=1 Tax=Eoetvoesiella caeni TaxID=645616 RepID=A0A366H1W3_9BURK|nr:hypothetical protein [Eoetvoesiella caeni]MCI2811017.1 hypothetical protein [Eoetvoesiella caeni]NYT56917.1 hypothetical protein [Eoetvoesiella caeni]RBP35241.1 hypothetical protein DFR37_11815 [Eoetvoesiella caeni]
MNRRHFITAASATALLNFLTGCKTEPGGEKFLGYWKSDKGNHPVLVHIERNGESFLFHETAWSIVGKVGYRTRTVPAVIKEADNILVISETVHLAYDEKEDVIVSGRMKAHRITETQYQSATNKT